MRSSAVSLPPVVGRSTRRSAIIIGVWPEHSYWEAEVDIRDHLMDQCVVCHLLLTLN